MPAKLEASAHAPEVTKATQLVLPGGAGGIGFDDPAPLVRIDPGLLVRNDPALSGVVFGDGGCRREEETSLLEVSALVSA